MARLLCGFLLRHQQSPPGSAGSPYRDYTTGMESLFCALHTHSPAFSTHHPLNTTDRLAAVSQHLQWNHSRNHFGEDAKYTSEGRRVCAGTALLSKGPECPRLARGLLEPAGMRGHCGLLPPGPAVPRKGHAALPAVLSEDAHLHVRTLGHGLGRPARLRARVGGCAGPRVPLPKSLLRLKPPECEVPEQTGPPGPRAETKGAPRGRVAAATLGARGALRTLRGGRGPGAGRALIG